MISKNGLAGIVAAFSFFVATVIFTVVEIDMLVTEQGGNCPRVTSYTSSLTLAINTTLTSAANLNTNVFGNTILFENDAEFMWDSNTSTIFPSSLAALQALKPPVLVFPGGPSSNYFSWSTSIPQNKQDQYGADGNLYYPNFGLFEFFTLCQELHSKPVWTFNVFSTTQQELQAFLAYVNGDPSDDTLIGVDNLGNDWYNVSYWANQRVNDRQVLDPFGLQYIELGFEVYSENVPYTLTPEQYGGIVINYTVAAKTIDPNISIGISISDDMSSGGWTDSLFLSIYTNKTLLEPYSINGLSFHIWNYYDLIPYQYIAKSVEKLMSEPRAIAQSFSDLNALVSQYPGIPTELWISGYNHQPIDYDVLNNLLDGFAMIDIGFTIMNGSGIGNLSVAFGNVYNLGDYQFGVFDSYDYIGEAILRSSFYALSMVMSVFGSSDFYPLQTAVIDGEFPTIMYDSTDDIFEVDIIQYYPAVDVYVYRNDSTIGIIILNKACPTFSLIVTIIGNSVIDTSRNVTFSVLNGNYEATEVVSSRGTSTPDSTTYQTGFHGWFNYRFWGSTGDISNLNYETRIGEFDIPITALGTSLTVCTIPIM